MQVHLLAKHISKTDDEIERAIARPTYFNPYEAVDFGIIDRVCPCHVAHAFAVITSAVPVGLHGKHLCTCSLTKRTKCMVTL